MKSIDELISDLNQIKTDIVKDIAQEKSKETKNEDLDYITYLLDEYTRVMNALYALEK